MKIVQALRRSGCALALSSLPFFTLASAVPDVVSNIISAPDIHNFSMADVTPQDGIRWSVWEDGGSDSRISHLVLFTGKKSIWSVQWSDAYNPVLQILPEWQWHGHPVAAVTLQFGAAASQLALYGLDEKYQPVRLLEKESASMGWIINENGQRLLALYDPKPTALKATCYAWNDSNGNLNPQPCK